MTNKEMTFENYIEDTSNCFAITACRALVRGKGYNPLLIYGASGCGKTHLLAATKNAIEKEYPDKRVGYFTANEVVCRFLERIREEDSLRTAIYEEYLGYDVFLLDGAEELICKEGIQEEIFHLIYTLVDNGRQVVVACALKPKRLRTLFKRLTKSLEKLCVCAISEPSADLRKKYATRTADELRLDLSESVISYIAKKHNRLIPIRGEILALRLMSDSDLRTL